jgi:ribosomal protein S19E (S16A)
MEWMGWILCNVLKLLAKCRKPILHLDWNFCKFAAMIKRIYIDTSVFGGYFDKEFEKETKPFFGKIILL